MSDFFKEQTSFNAGIYDALLAGFSDAPRRKSAVKDCLNIIPMIQGGMIRRGGSQFIAEVKFSTKDTYLIKFKSGDKSSYTIEMGDLYMRFYKNRTQLESAPSVPVEIVTSYPSADFFDADGLFNFQFIQSADVMYIVHKDHKVASLSRFSDTSWSLTDMAYNEHPYNDENTSATTFTASAAVVSGTVTITASATTDVNGGVGFRASDVGRGLRILKQGQKWGWGEITVVNSNLSVDVDIDENSSGTSVTATKRWRLGLYNDDDLYPSVIGIHNQRIVLCGQSTNADRVVMSAVGGFSPTSFDFSPTDELGVVQDDDAIQVRVQNGELNFVEWVNDLSNGLAIGTTDSEWLITPAGSSKPLSPSNVKVSLVTSKGSASAPSVTNGFATVFIQASRSKIHEAAFSIESDGVRSPDIGLFFINNLRSRVKSMTWNQEPDNIFYFPVDNGDVFGMTYMREEGIVAWSRHRFAGTAAGNAKVINMVSVPSPSNDRDDLYILVDRTINGVQKKYVEWVTPYFRDGDTREDLIYADSAFVYSGAATGTVTGIDHLEGETVGVLVNGKAHPDQVVTGGAITLSNNVTGTKIIVGLKYQWSLTLLDPVDQTSQASDKGRMRIVSGLILELWKTLGIRYSQEDSNTTDEDVLGYGVKFDTLLPLFTGNTNSLSIPSAENNRKTHIKLSHDGMLPACVLSCTWEMFLEGR